MSDTLKMLELELIDHVGLDSVVYLRIYLLRMNQKKYSGVLFLYWNDLGQISTVIRVACTLNCLHCPRSIFLLLLKKV
ncbi:hypothetical protein HanIR_Chr01g0022381 [Helianthus annuus]|nr:hypothetical protein HanIR_Chr01g0022381 [Helianthus annuus]